MLPITIAGLGYYLPERRVDNAELEAKLGIPEGWIERVAGVRERRYASGETSAGMAAAAGRQALAAAGMSPGDLDAIIGASAAPQQAIPCTAVFVQRELGAPEGRSACFDLNATCLSFLFAVQTAAHLIAAGTYRTILVFSSELTSNSLNPNERESAVLFGDAAAAAVLTRAARSEQSGIYHTQFATWHSGAEASQVLGAGTLHHPNDPATLPEMNQFTMSGPAIFRQASRLIGPFVNDIFTKLEWQREDLAAVVPHQASRHAVELLTSRLGFRPDQVISNLAVRGNCISVSIPLALAEAVEDNRIRRGDRVLLLGSGAGLTLGAVALVF